MNKTVGIIVGSLAVGGLSHSAYTAFVAHQTSDGVRFVNVDKRIHTHLKKLKDTNMSDRDKFINLLLDCSYRNPNIYNLGNQVDCLEQLMNTTVDKLV